MQFGLSESQQILQTNARKFFAAECPISETRRIIEAGAGFDGALWGKLAAQGYTGAIFPEEYGGLGLGIVELALLFEEMGRALIPGPFLPTVVAGLFLDAAGSDQQKEKFLRPICEGSAKACIGGCEPNAAYDCKRIEMRGDGAISGTKLFVAGANVADFFVALTKNGAFVARAGDRVRIAPMHGLDITRPLYSVEFDNAPAERLPYPERLSRAVDIGTLAVAAETVGGMQRVLDIAVEYAKTRKQFGQPIGKYQAVQHMCADSYLETESGRSAVYYAAWALQESAPDAVSAVSIAKMYVSDASRSVGNRGIQIHGGMGFTWENDVHLYYRRFKSNETTFGDATYHRERIASLVIDAGRAGHARA